MPHAYSYWSDFHLSGLHWALTLNLGLQTNVFVLISNVETFVDDFNREVGNN